MEAEAAWKTTVFAFLVRTQDFVIMIYVLVQMINNECIHIHSLNYLYK